MGLGGETLLRLPVRCEPDAPASVRRALECLLADHWILGDVMLVATELVAGAMAHGPGVPGETLTVEVVRREDRLLVTVSNPSGHGHTSQAGRPAEEFDPIGLRIVEQLAFRWGENSGDGYAVWAEIDLPAESPADVV